MPSGRAIRTMSRTGMICPVRFVMCVTSMTFVRGVIACAELLDEILVARRRHLEGDLLEHDPLARHALLPRS